MRRAARLMAGLLLGATAPLAAQSVHPVEAPEVRAVRLEEPIRLDGRLDEAVWRTAPPATGFRQSQPNEGQASVMPTEVRFAYDDAAIYVGARMYDSLGAAGVRTRMVRRDAQADADYLQVIFDTYHDHIGRLFFAVNPSGVRSDANGLGGGGDPSWDPVWEVKTVIDSLGWTAEMRIPFSQLRYPRTEAEQTWGLQILRQSNRLNELSHWAWWSRTESGGPSRYGHLRGLVITGAPGRGEVLPYVVGRASSVPVRDPSDPFQRAQSVDGRLGADARILLTSNLTLNATVNPDFGQVEVDPAVVNLSAFETFFDERRPFFVEGAGYFGFGGNSCYFCSNTSSLSMFYSRRVGRAPQAPGAAFSRGPFADVPDNTAILGAVKLTGRTAGGWSIGALDAVTRREQATVQLADSSRTRVTVEPFANYFVGRVAKDLRGGATVVRAMATSVVRDLEDPYLRDRLSSHAETFGLSTESWFGRRDYRLMLQVAGTQVSGDSLAMDRLQRSSARYFQRPDRQHGSNGLLSDAYDPSATSLRGLGAYGRFARETGRLLWEVSSNLRTPGFENNDIAFLSRADYWWMSANVFPQWTRPTRWYRQLFFIAGGQQAYNFDGDLTDRQGHAFMYYELRNYWTVNAFYIYRPDMLDDRLSRGGPVLGRPSTTFMAANVSSDSRRSVVLNANLDRGCNSEGSCSRSASLSVRLRPASNISLSFGPSVSHSETGFQFVTSLADTTAAAFYGRRYVFAGLTQNAVSMNTRVNVTFTPNLTFELFAQPLIASGRFDRYNEFAAPRDRQRLVYGEDVGTVAVLPGPRDTIVIDPDGAGPAQSFRIVDPSFTLRSLRGNAVLRWEYRPGSTLFLVWTRQAASQLSRGAIDFGEDSRALLRGPSDNIFLVKVSYRIGV